MRLGILSDTHDQIARLREAIHLLRGEGADVLVHCGDITRAETVAACAGLPCYFAFGNHDADDVPGLGRAMADARAVCLGWGGEVTLAGKRVAITHGHMTTDIRRLLAGRPDYLLTGHSHIAHDRQEGPTRRINPGALHEADDFTVAMLDLGTDVLRWFLLTS